MKKGTLITGKWNKKTYTIEKVLGKGSIGKVYLVKDKKGKKFALKCSDDIRSITNEFNFLKNISFSFAPKVYELDDGYINYVYKHFFIMEYIEGVDLKTYFTRENDIKKILAKILDLSTYLDEIYKSGYIYWDINISNIIIEKDTKSIKIIDFAGVSKVGQSIKEYTPSYNAQSFLDKSYYDDRSLVFSINMLIVSIITKKTYNPLTNNIENIIYKIKEFKINKDIKGLIIRGLKGEYKISAYIYDMENMISPNKSSYYNQVIDKVFITSIGLFLVFLSFLIKNI
ncbi:MAG: protein kinase domain-containing protein [Senegalia sp. (in: firmicutes)]|uniref:protein kinase domain-containing protein n=1 Tax=Senegalia sp. (in: firmicutes) TaxID=1924098 RepID=UPI003F99883B